MLGLAIAQANDPNWATIMGSIAAAVTALIAGVAAAGAFLGLRQNRARDRETRAHRYLERYNSPPEISSRTRVHDFFMSGPRTGRLGRRRWERARIGEWEGMTHAEKLDTVQGLNFWEELAGMYNLGLVDDEIVSEYFGTAALSIWAGTRWFVEYLRRDQPATMEQFEKMCDAVRERRRTGD